MFSPPTATPQPPLQADLDRFDANDDQDNLDDSF